MVRICGLGLGSLGLVVFQARVGFKGSKLKLEFRSCMEGFLPPTGVSERLVLVKTFQPESTLTTSLPFVATVTSGKRGERRSQRGGGDTREGCRRTRRKRMAHG